MKPPKPTGAKRSKPNVAALLVSSELRITWVRERVRYGHYQISEHVIRFIMAGLLTIHEIEAAIKTGEIIKIKPAAHRSTCVLIRGRFQDKTILVQASKGHGDWLIISLAYLATYPRWSELASSAPDKGNSMQQRTFRQCFFCGGELKAITVGNFDYRLEGQLYVIKDTPAGLCLQCGEKYVTAETAKKINRLIENRQFTRTEAVRVISFDQDDVPARSMDER